MRICQISPDHAPRRGGLRALALAVLTVLPLSACSLFDTGDPETVRVQIEGESAEPVQLVVSQEFLVGAGSDGGDGVSVQFGTADTLLIDLPFDRSYPLAPTFRFLARAQGDPEIGEPVTLRMRILVDGNERYNQSRTLDEDFLQFVYLFQ